MNPPSYIQRKYGNPVSLLDFTVCGKRKPLLLSNQCARKKAPRVAIDPTSAGEQCRTQFQALLAKRQQQKKDAEEENKNHGRKEEDSGSMADNSEMMMEEEEQDEDEEKKKKVNKLTKSCRSFFTPDRDPVYRLRRIATFIETYSLSEQQIQFLQRIALGKDVFVTGGAGTGKSFAMILAYNFLRKEGYHIACVASTATAARNLMPEATTLHAFMGIGAKLPNAEEFCTLLKSKKFQFSNRTKRWQNTQVILIDEISMIDEELFTLFIHVARLMKGQTLLHCKKKKTVEDDEHRVVTLPPAQNSHSEGYNVFSIPGLQLIICGDFCQLPPVVVADVNNNNNKPFCFQAPEWQVLFPKEQVVVLKEVFRQAHSEFIKALNELRFGTVSDSTHALLESRVLPTGAWVGYDDTPSAALYFDNEESNKLHVGICPPLLTTHRWKADRFNKERLEQLDSSAKQKTFEATVIIKSAVGAAPVANEAQGVAASIKTEREEKQRILKKSGVVEFLVLKVGARVMLTVNLDIEQGWYNGLCGVVQDLDDSCGASVLFDDGRIECISAYDFKEEQGSINVVQQLPLVLCWAITIHKSQSASLECAIVDIDASFENGQIYVAISRVKKPSGLFLTRWSRSSLLFQLDDQVLNFYSQLC